MVSELLVFYIFSLVLVIGISKLVSVMKRKKILPPGPFRWPIVGNVLELNSLNAKYPHLALASMAEKYGDVISLGFGVHYAVLISSYEAMKDILRKNEACMSRYEFPFVADRAFQKNLGIIWAHGSSWSEIRRFTTRSIKDFGLGKPEVMEKIILQEMEALADYLKSSVLETEDGIWQVDSHRFAASAINILWSLVGGFRFPLDDKRLERNIQNNDEIVEVVGHSNVYTVFPFLKTWFPKWSQFERHKEINRESQAFLKEIIEKIKDTRSKRMDKTAQNFVESFLDEIDRNATDPTSNFTEEQLIVTLMDLFLGGSETSSTALNWAIVFLVLNPRVQRKVQEEISEVLQSGSPISLQKIRRMPYLKATLLEVLRLSDFVPIPAVRRADADIEYNGHVIPKGAALFFNMEPVLKDKKYWGDPEVFRPERFLNPTQPSKLIKTERVAVFGFGKRICPGEALAWDTMSMFLITILRNFNFEVIPGFEPSTQEPHPAITLSPRPYRVKIIQRTA